MGKTEFYNSLVKWLSCHTDQSCLLCTLPSNASICSFCLADLDTFDRQHMPKNLLHVPRITNHLNKPQYHVLKSIGWYRWPFDELILKCKLGRNLVALDALGNLFCQSDIIEEKEKPELLLPVPSSLRTLWERQFNQAVELAKLMGKRFDIPIYPHWATRRTWGNTSQRQLSRGQRRGNAKRAFVVYDIPEEINHVAIVDDVITTGATVNYLCEQLKQRRPTLNIEVWALAITPSQDVD